MAAWPRYGNDDQYLSTVIRYDLEFLDLCPCMVDVEIIDAKNGQVPTPAQEAAAQPSCALPPTEAADSVADMKNHGVCHCAQRLLLAHLRPQGSILVSADPEMCNCGSVGSGGMGGSNHGYGFGHGGHVSPACRPPPGRPATPNRLGFQFHLSCLSRCQRCIV